MGDFRFENLMNEAGLLLRRAQDELNKPEEDVVPISICLGSKKAIDLYLKAFLVKHQEDNVDEGNLADRLKRCKEIQPEFSTIDFRPLDCLDDTSCRMADYCMSIGKVAQCQNVGAEVRELIFRK